jgi:putative flippase GtrA
MSVVRTPHPIPRFVIVGCTNFVVSLAVFYLCFRYLPRVDGVSPAAAANVVAYFAGMINSFLLNRSWTFRADGHVGAQALRFVTVNLLSLAMSTFVVFLFVDVLRYPALAVWVPLAALIVVTNYVGFRYWAFAPRTLEAREPG